MASDKPFFEPLDGAESPAAPDSAPEPEVFDVFEDEASQPFSLDEPVSGESEALNWNALLTATPQAVIVLGHQQEILFTNPAHRELLDLDAATCEGGMDEYFQRLCDPEEEAKVISSWREHIWRNQLTRTFPMVHPSEGAKQIEFRAALDPDGFMVVLQKDVTDVFGADEALREATSKFHSIFLNAAGGIVLVDEEGRICEVNDAFVEFSGMEARELEGMRFADLLEPEDGAALKGGAEAGEGFEEARKLRFRFEGAGAERSAMVTCSTVVNRHNRTAFRIYQLRPRDTQLLAKLKDLSAKAQSLLHAVPDMFILLDRAGVVKDFSAPITPWDHAVVFHNQSVGKPAADSWEEFGKVIDEHLENVFEDGVTLRFEVKGDSNDLLYPVSLSPFGRDMALALIEAPAPEVMAAPPEKPERWKEILFGRSPEAMLVVDAEGRIVEANGAAQGVTGMDEPSLLESTLFQLLSKSPGKGEDFDPVQFRGQTGAREWSNLLSVSPSGPLPVTLKVIPFPGGDAGERMMAMILPRGVEASAASSSRDLQELAYRDFRGQIQMLSSLFAVGGAGDLDVSTAWLLRLKVLAEAVSSGRRPGLVLMLRDIADQVSTVIGRGLGHREVVVTGASSISVEPDLAAPFALLLGELMALGIRNSPGSQGPAMFIDAECRDGDISLTVRPGENQDLFSTDRIKESQAIEILVEQLRGKISVGIGEGDEKAAALRLTFPSHQG